MSIGELLQECFDAKLLTYQQVNRFALTFGDVYDQRPPPGEFDPDGDTKFTVWIELVDFSQLIAMDARAEVLGAAFSGETALDYTAPAGWLQDRAAAALHLLKRIREGEPAAAVISNQADE